MRDRWSKIEILTKLFGSVGLGVFGLVFTILYNQSQTKLRELELMLQMEPLLNSGDPKKIAYAFQTADAVGFEEKILETITSNPSESVVAAALSIADNPNTSEQLKESIENSLEHLRRVEPEEFRQAFSNSQFDRNLTSIHVHHTYIPNIELVKKVGEKETLLRMYRYHTEDLGHSDIGAHFFVSPTGGIWVGRNLDSPPISVKGHNGSSQEGPVAITLVVNGEVEDPTEDQKKSFVEIIQTLNELHSINIERDIFNEGGFHRTLDDSKSCPGMRISGKDMKDWYEKYVEYYDS